MVKRVRVISGVLLMLLVLVGVFVGIWQPQSRRSDDVAEAGPWRRVLAFDATRRDRDFKADLGNNTIVIARYERPIGWEVGVYAYPVTDDSDNLLADGEDYRGAQPWQSFAWSQKKKMYPDVRVIEYGKPKQKLKVILKDCKTVKHDGVVVFSAGRIEVYHQP